jgi:hypothetical protein
MAPLSARGEVNVSHKAPAPGLCRLDPAIRGQGEILPPRRRAFPRLPRYSANIRQGRVIGPVRDGLSSGAGAARPQRSWAACSRRSQPITGGDWSVRPRHHASWVGGQGTVALGPSKGGSRLSDSLPRPHQPEAKVLAGRARDQRGLAVDRRGPGHQGSAPGAPDRGTALSTHIGGP